MWLLGSSSVWFLFCCVGCFFVGLAIEVHPLCIFGMFWLLTFVLF